MRDGELLLDSNVAIALFRHDAGVQQALWAAQRIFIPVIVVGELFAGALKAGQAQQERARIKALLASGQVLDCDVETAEHYAQVKDELRRRGRPIPENDVWIAALARQHGLTLASRDGHFDEVGGLRREPCRN
jgi:tRNA(fMet)-specific endonuclease VapC